VLTSGGVEDHVHLLMKIHPKFAISTTMQLIKSNSSRWINERRPVAAKFSWQRGYGAFSVSQSMAETVKQYIQNQRHHHRKLELRDEYLEMLRRHRIEFDERYVFEDEIVT
jgi:putative transposase